MIKKCLHTVFCALLLLFLSGKAAGQTTYVDSLTLEVGYPVNESSVDYQYAGNGERINAFLKQWRRVKNTCQVKEVIISGSTSPEGPARFNQQLAEERAMNLGQWLAWNMGLDSQNFRYFFHNRTGADIPEYRWEQCRQAGANVKI